MQYIFIASETTKKKLTALSVLYILKVKYIFFLNSNIPESRKIPKAKNSKVKNRLLSWQKKI